jgi:predicted aspartyl protease
MRTFCTRCRIENHTDRTRAARIPKLLVDTGSQYAWVPAATLQRIGVVREKKDLRFVLANGEIITRSVGIAVLRLGRGFHR